MDTLNQRLRNLPSVDELLKTETVQKWQAQYPRTLIVKAVRDGLDNIRSEIIKSQHSNLSIGNITETAYKLLIKSTTYNLRPVINATGTVIHTNLGRAPLSQRSVEHIMTIAQGYSNLEYDLAGGMRGKRYSHIKNIIKDITGAEDAIVVNNNAAAVLLCLSTLAAGRQTIVSRGELVEIGGSFRIPDILAQSGSILREVGTTNKTRISDYEFAINDNTGLFLKVHKSNFKTIGFTEEVPIEELVELSKKYTIPVMYDLGSGCFIDLKPYGIHTEPTVQEIIANNVDVITFSGDKLTGGPQGGIIAGKTQYISRIQSHPLTRALRVDKFTLAALESTLMEYSDIEDALKNIPVLNMLFTSAKILKERAVKIKKLIKKGQPNLDIEVISDSSMAGGGTLPEQEFPTFVVSIKPSNLSVNAFETALRLSDLAIIARIKDDRIILDARTILDNQIKITADSVIKIINQGGYK
ncbi:MAG: L-seryl-tRNA(Sec) selenium transferase [Nitrospirae bacterium]|nr:L-seryl-tRNA(Sec) selenium transferase [Nitrospirota bacterium]